MTKPTRKNSLSRRMVAEQTKHGFFKNLRNMVELRKGNRGLVLGKNLEVVFTDGASGDFKHLLNSYTHTLRKRL